MRIIFRSVAGFNLTSQHFFEGVEHHLSKSFPNTSNGYSSFKISLIKVFFVHPTKEGCDLLDHRDCPPSTHYKKILINIKTRMYQYRKYSRRPICIIFAFSILLLLVFVQNVDTTSNITETARVLSLLISSSRGQIQNAPLTLLAFKETEIMLVLTQHEKYLSISPKTLFYSGLFLFHCNSTFIDQPSIQLLLFQ